MIRWMLGWMLDGSWIDCWWIWGPSWEASWHQVGTKIQKERVPKRCQKMNGNKNDAGVLRVARGARSYLGVWALKNNQKHPYKHLTHLKM